MKAIGLIRVSTKVQELESQSEKVKQAILKDGFDESDIILIEDKESGSKLSEQERSGLNKMKRIIETDQISSVYAYEISRISRKASVVFSIRDYLISRGINLIILNPYFRMLKDDGSISPESNIFFGIFSSMAENETFLRTERLMRGKAKKTAEGKLSVGSPVFGYMVDENHYVHPHPKDSLIIKEIFERYCDGESSGSIGKDLWLRNALHTKSNKLVTYQTYVSWLLKDARYAKMDETSVYPPIISKELYLKTKEIREHQPEHFKRKGLTKEIYPLQGYIFTEDGYCLTPSITNNRYVKMSGISKRPISLNMKAADALSIKVMNEYLLSGAAEQDRQKQYAEISEKYENDKLKLANIDLRIQQLEIENSRINRRIISGRMSEIEGDKMIDTNHDEIKSLEDLRQDLTYNLSVMSNKLIVLANPLHLEIEKETVQNLQELKDAVHKYMKKIVAVKIGFSNYRLTYYFQDSTVIVAEFLSTKKGLDMKIVNKK